MFFMDYKKSAHTIGLEGMEQHSYSGSGVYEALEKIYHEMENVAWCCDFLVDGKKVGRAFKVSWVENIRHSWVWPRVWKLYTLSKPDCYTVVLDIKGYKDCYLAWWPDGNTVVAARLIGSNKTRFYDKRWEPETLVEI